MRKSNPVIGQILHGMGVGGAEVLAARIARQLSDRFEFRFFCLDWLGELGEQLRDEGFTVEVLERKSGLDWRFPWRLARRLRQEQVALIQAHQYTPFFYSLAARMLYWKAPILFTEHGRHIPDYPRKKRKVYNRMMLRRRDRIVAVGEAVRQALIVNEGLPARRVEVIYNGVNMSPYANSNINRNEVRQELGIAPETIVVFQVARLDAVKDHLTGLRAMELVNHRRSDVQLVIVGDGPELEKIEQFIAEHRLTESVKLLGTRQDVPRLLQVGDVFLLTSISEGIPLTIIEAGAAGLPVVSTRAGGVDEVTVHEKSGLLADVGDHVKLAEHLLRLAGDIDLRQALGNQGRQIAFERFTEPVMLDAYERLYREMLP